ncbi:MAG: FadR family transcriptional regulator [Anaerolineales bacterium]|nr:FadR family transcriptional regulator [Anaerolineales bacterium]
MLRERTPSDISEFFRYLASHPEAESGLPSLPELSRELDISLASLREQLEVARALGLVEVRPRTGTRKLTYSFTPAIRQSLGYAIALNNDYFQKFSDMRNHLEAAYWYEAVAKLTNEDKQELQALITRALQKIRGTPVLVPHEEHRKLHLLIFNRLDNTFVTGVLEAYWEAYEAVGLNVFAGGYEYLQEVWQYHQRMIESICNNQFEVGYEALVKHTDLLFHRP